ncbi:MAG: nodulation protein NfeD [Clostridiales bacterium]|nr:nodulation protein NfeD [Clostridiales bacterium]
MSKKFFLFILSITIVIGIVSPVFEKSWSAGNETVYIIPVEGEITPAMATFFKKSIQDAESVKADAILIELSTFGGRVDATLTIKEAIEKSEIPIIVYIKDRAVSAGALIAITAPRIIMAPGSHIGSAEPIPYSAKAVAAIRGEFEAAAERNDRDKSIAAAMVDKEVDIPGLSPAGSLLDITAGTAKEYGYAEEILESRQKVLDYLGFEDAFIIENQPDLLIRLAQLLTRSSIAPFLLTIGIIAIIIEIFTQGFGIAGIIGISSLTLYFGANLLAGYSQWWPIILFFIGIILLIVEFFIPGFGLPGIGGIIAILTGIIFAAADPVRGMINLGVALVLVVILTPILILFLKRFGTWRSFVLSETIVGKPENNMDDLEESLVGKKGIVLTTLRPPGIVEIDGKRLDAISQGEFISPGTLVKVIEDKGLSIVVSKDKN